MEPTDPHALLPGEREDVPYPYYLERVPGERGGSWGRGYGSAPWHGVEKGGEVEKRARVEVYAAAPEALSTSMWRWRLKAANGEIVCQGEAHTSERDAKRAAMTVAAIFWDAPDVVTVEA